MEFIASPTEQTTAITNLILALIGFASLLYLLRLGPEQRRRRQIWITLFALLAINAVLGSIAHGLQLSDSFHALIWYLLNFLIILLVSLFAVAALHDLFGVAILPKALPPMLLIGLLIYASLYIGEGTFLWVILYQAVVMLFSLGAYFTLALRGALQGAWWIVAGLLATLVAAAVQASGSIGFTLIWPFDHNGVFHLVQMVGVVLLGLGLRAGLLARS